MAAAMRAGETVPHGPTSRDLTGKQVNFQPGVVFDDKPLGKDFGELGAIPAPMGAAGLDKFWKDEMAYWRNAIREANVKLD